MTNDQYIAVGAVVLFIAVYLWGVVQVGERDKKEGKKVNNDFGM